MNEYAASVFVISSIVGLLSHLSYNGKSDPSRIAMAVILLYVVVAPIADLVSQSDGSIFDVNYDESIVDEDYEIVAEEAFDKGILSAVADKFSLNKENLRVEIYGFDFENMRAERIRVILSGKAVLADNNITVDENRILTECAIYADKAAIDEELVRLSSHFKALDEIVNANEAFGRKLDFLLQEINREVNTIGSKAGNTEIAHLVVDMKTELEKIREQIQNLE